MVQHLDYKKDKLPVRISYRALKALKGRDLSKLVSGNSVLDDELFEDLLWAGLRSGHTYEEKELKLKREEMEDVLDDCFLEFVKMIPLFFAKEQVGVESKPVGNVEPNLAQEESETNPTIGTI